jgi:hypothetical protein
MIDLNRTGSGKKLIDKIAMSANNNNKKAQPSQPKSNQAPKKTK